MTVRVRGLRMVAAAGVVLAAGAALTACQGDSSGDDAAGGGRTQAPATATADPGAPATTGPAEGSTTAPGSPAKAGDGGTSGTSGGSGAQAGPSRCLTSNLGFSFGPDSGAQAVGSPGAIEVVLSNKGGAACTLKGFPGVDIVSASGTHWSLARQAESAAAVKLAPGADASFTLTYLPFDSADSGGSRAFHAASILVTPPDETHSATLKWDGFADVMDQSGATHPGTYVGPVTSGR